MVQMTEKVFPHSQSKVHTPTPTSSPTSQASYLTPHILHLEYGLWSSTRACHCLTEYLGFSGGQVGQENCLQNLDIATWTFTWKTLHQQFLSLTRILQRQILKLLQLTWEILSQQSTLWSCDISQGSFSDVVYPPKQDITCNDVLLVLSIQWHVIIIHMPILRTSKSVLFLPPPHASTPETTRMYIYSHTPWTK